MPTVARLNVNRLPDKFISDDSRVITRPFLFGGSERKERIIQRVLGLSETEVHTLLEDVFKSFKQRHREIGADFMRHYEMVAKHVLRPSKLSNERKLLLGSYFTMEYSIESAALFNPSMVPLPQEMQTEPGRKRFIMSLRATGEGHISSIVFRTGSIDENAHISFDPTSEFASRMKVVQDQLYDKKLFFLKLIEMGAYSDTARVILDELEPHFTFNQLSKALDEVRRRPNRPHPFSETAENMLWLAKSNYHLDLPMGCNPNEIVIFPTSDNESKGIEDVRLTHFTEDDGTTRYYGTYTAYNGYRILPQLLETEKFDKISIHTLNGKYVQNKGMALFPRKINGLYHMVSRLDGENMFMMKSDNIFFWNECEKFCTPQFHWEFVQVGNCGAPIEVDEGWILLTHGVGPMRQYCIGAMLLDKENPRDVIGQLAEPLLMPNEEERDGYVPNVVYSCGGMIHAGQLIIPYAMSDSATKFATVGVDELVALMKG